MPVQRPVFVDDGLITPSHFKKFFRPVAKRVFLLFSSQTFQRFAKRGGYDQTRARAYGPLNYVPGRDKRDFGLAGPVTGAPAAALAVEFLAMLGAEQIVCLGICGSIHGHVRIGSAVVPVGGCSEEGTSGLYLPDNEDYSADAALTESVRAAAWTEGLKPRDVHSWTTDAFFRETPGKIARYRSAGCQVVEMEWTAISAVARCRGVAAAALWVVSDELFGRKWKAGFLNPQFHLGLRKAATALLRLRD